MRFQIRHLYWILTGPSFTVSTSILSNYLVYRIYDAQSLAVNMISKALYKQLNIFSTM
jgi:hypothetical protein